MAVTDKTTDVLVRTAGGAWQRPTGEGYVNEYELQQVLGEQPSLIEGVSADAVAVREFSTGVGPADLVVVDRDGTVTVVECKLARNQEIRRTIMGQVLDYASSLAEMTPDDFVRQWTAQGGSPLDALFEQAPEGRESLTTNLRAGVFTLVLAVDTINDDLRRIVRYLNTHTSAGMRLLAIELRRVTHGQTEILIPTVYGSESADDKNARRSTGTTVRWTHADVDVFLRERDPALADAVASFETELAAAGFRVKGGGAGIFPSYSICGTTASGSEVAPFSVYCGDSRSTLGLNFEYVSAATVEGRQRFLQELAASIPTVKAPAIEAARYQKRPSVLLDLVLDRGTRTHLVAAAANLLT
ncbi:hypothetical protein [Geodermatophilus sp. SYSU D00684]